MPWTVALRADPICPNSSVAVTAAFCVRSPEATACSTFTVVVSGFTIRLRKKIPRPTARTAAPPITTNMVVRADAYSSRASLASPSPIWPCRSHNSFSCVFILSALGTESKHNCSARSRSPPLSAPIVASWSRKNASIDGRNSAQSFFSLSIMGSASYRLTASRALAIAVS